MNSKIGKILEFDKIIYQLGEETETALGKKYARKLQPMTDRGEIDRALTDIDELGRLNDGQKQLPIGSLEDLGSIIKRLEIGADLNGQELAQVSAVLKASHEVVEFFRDLEESDLDLELNQLPDYAEDIVSLPDLSRKLSRSVAPDGSVYDEASPKLQQIRHSIHKEQSSARIQLENMMRSKSQYLSDRLITVRNDRYVLPVKQEYRHSVPGVIHDQSASGQTLYIEPQSVVDSNNRIQDLRVQEKAEIERIFSELSAELAPHAGEIQKNNQVLGRLDFIRAKYRLARKMEAHRPQLADDNQDLYLQQAVHPFLERKTAVANDIYFGEGIRMLIITGSNTGGKTVTLRTMGLLQLMGQSGLYITAEEGSRIGVFEEVFADIGDEQSIEANLSTFSGHMTNIISILDQANQHSLVLIDELGSGTDPSEGAALARAILNAFSDRQVMVMVTTHYPELKTYAFDKEDAVNASVEFDEKTLTPTYRLHIGEPGRSNGIDIAQRLGLDENIVDQARAYVDQSSQDLNQMLEELDQERQRYEKQTKEVNRRIHKADNLLHDLKQTYSELRKTKDRYISQAKHESNQLVSDTREKADKIMGEIRDWQLNQQDGKVKEHEMIEKQHDLDQLTYEEDNLKKNKVLKKAKQENRPHELAPGDEVKVLPYDQQGSLVEKRDNDKWLVQVGALKMEVAADDLVYIGSGNTGQSSTTSVKARGAKKVGPELDLRGYRYNDAMIKLDSYLDSALLSGYKEVTIIHGFGTGAIRKGVQSALKNDSRVDHFEYAPYNRGGNGATVVHFK